jgi:hypothetical protein
MAQESQSIKNAQALEECLCSLWGCTVCELPPHALALIAGAWRIEMVNGARKRLLDERDRLLAESRRMAERFRNQADIVWEEIRQDRIELHAGTHAR